MSKNLSVFNYGQTKVIFGRNSIQEIITEMNRLSIMKPLIVTDEQLYQNKILDPLIQQLEKENVAFMLFDKVTPDPISSLVDNGVAVLKENACDGVIGIGGGSVMDCAKCIAAMCTNSGVLLDYDHANKNYKNFENVILPLINIPTTSGTGSEVSPYAVITNEKEYRKATIGSPLLISSVALLDPIFIDHLPPKATASTGMDALTHCIEAYTSINSLNNSNPIIDALALKGIELIYTSLLQAYSNSEKKARERVLWGSLIGGIVLQYGSGASHGLGNVLGGELHVPHGTAVGMLLPHVIAFNYDACEERYKDIAKAMHLSCKDDNVKKSIVDSLQTLLDKMDFPVFQDYCNDIEKIKKLSTLAVVDKCTRINAKKVNEEDAYNIYQYAMMR